VSSVSLLLLHFDDYVEAVSWAQELAMYNRKLMMEQLVDAVAESGEVPDFKLTEVSVNCHIPGSMGTRSYIVRGLGNPESFDSCSHGAGRAMSRNEAKRRFSTADHANATEGIECRRNET
jgi:tRNA-splicing ligase RtcB